MRHFGFYFRQAGTNLRSNPQRTLFVLFCIAVGVGAVVSLRTMGLMIGHGLTSNLQVDNRADIKIGVPSLDDRFGDSGVDPEVIEEGGEFSETRFTEAGLEQLRAWASENDSEILFAIRDLKPSSMYPVEDRSANPVTAMTYFVESERYPLYGTRPLLQPEGGTLAAALAKPDGIVLSDRLAKRLDVGVGDALRIRGPEPFVVTGVIDNAAEARMREMEAVVLPWALLPYEAGITAFSGRADTVYLKIPEDGDLAALTEEFKETFPGLRVFTTEDLRENNAELSTRLTQLVTTMGLISLLIGGIGIINTMLVVVGRRTLEIGVLKTLGLQGRQITWMFLLEALALGIGGSLLGVLLGLGMVSVLQGVAENVASQSLAFQIFPEAVVLGLVTGVLVTLVFGFLPTLSAGRVRPNVVLQPDQGGIPTAGLGLSLLVVTALTGVIGILVGQILDNLLLGIGISYAAMAGLALVTWLFRLLVRFLGWLPSMGSIYLKLSQRALATHPGRAASTLLALVVGMFALSSILLMTGSLLNVINDVMEEKLGGDIIVVPDNPRSSDLAEAAIAELAGVGGITHQVVYETTVAAINGNRDVEALEEAAYIVGDLEREEEEDSDSEEQAGEDVEEEEADEQRFDPTSFRLRNFLGHFSVTPQGKGEDPYEIAEGRDVSAGGELEVVLRHSKARKWLGLEVGDTLTILFGDEEREVTVVGLMAEPPENGFNVRLGEDTTAISSAGVIPAGTVPDPTPFILEVEDAHMNDAIRQLSQIKGVFALHVSLINQLLTDLFQKLTALPLVVAILALFAAGVIIANSVSLAVLERRRQIGIMKAVGLHASDVLKMLLLENGLLGLLGGLLGTGIGAGMIIYMGVLSESPGSFPFGTLALLIALAVAISLAATLLTAWGAAREKPLIVLRYE